MGSSLNDNLNVLFSKMENFVSTKTIVGEPMTVGDIILLPLIDVSVGVGAGGGDGGEDKKNREFGGGGLGAKISPSAVIAIQNGTIQLINIKNQDSINKIIDLAPGILSNVASFFDGDKKGAKKKAEEETHIITDI